MTSPLTQHELDDAGRAHRLGRWVNCDHVLVLHTRCHIAAATWVKYVKLRGVLIVECAACGKTVAEIAVAP